MRYLSIDYGLKRLGLAICDRDETIVSPLRQLRRDRRQPEKLIQHLCRIIDEQNVDALVLGLPLNMDGTEGAQAQITRRFADDLAHAVSLPIHLQDERLSSSAADETLAQTHLSRDKQKARRDMLAACNILDDFLQQKQSSADGQQQHPT